MSGHKFSLITFILYLIYLHATDASWRMSCSVIQTGRIDPILSPGQVSSHTHKIVGASNIGLNSTYETLQTANCTSCEIQADKSAYWAPLLYYQHSNGSFEEVASPGTTIYYLGRGDVTSDIKPFPPGLRIVSGDALTRSYDKTTLTYKNGRPVADRVSFACLDTQPLPETPGLSRTQCANGLRAQIHFQSCWNGKDLYKEDFSHVAYMSEIDNGVCPPGYPVHFMHLFLEVLYSVFDIKQDGGRFVFANGDPTGYGFHGEFINGWDECVLAAGIKQCATADASGDVAACPALAPSDIDDYAAKCPTQPPLVNEPATGMIAKLPGCITITDGPAEASLADIYCPPGHAQPSVNKAPSNTKSSATSLCKNKNSTLSAATRFSSGLTSVNVASSSAGSHIPSAMPPPAFIHTGTSSVTTGAGPAGSVSTINMVGSYVLGGCYHELTGGHRALNGAKYTDAANMTVGSCISFCEKKGFGYAGVACGEECYCGSTITTSPTASSACNIPCTGNKTEMCGGMAMLGMYQSG